MSQITLIKKDIKGQKGQTVCYTIPNIRIENNLLKWDAFRFYTPLGDQDDGDKYFDVPADEIPIQRHEELDKSLTVCITIEGGVEPFDIYPGYGLNKTIGLEGDAVIKGRIPADPQADIIIKYKEVTDG